ncbi:MAG: VCBS repeat-containing protein [Verrucomicrobia bacterium]|nr:VCBS repeat-containing protein [Verrucomicrobiota bacterium]
MRVTLILSTSILILVTTLTGHADRSFEAVTNTSLPNVSRFPALRVANIDGDSDDDIVLSGHLGGVSWAGGIYSSDGDGTFTDVGATILQVDYADAAWGDYDNDGDADLAIGGEGASGVRGAEIYRNDGGNVFTDINAELRNAGSLALSWGDPDDNGLLDLALSGNYFSINKFFDFYQNLDGTNFIRRTSVGPAEVYVGAMAFCDVNGDGADDLINTGEASGTILYTALFYYGTGNTNLPFTGGPNVFQPVRYSSVDWGDYDGDTYPDLLLTGATNQFGEGCTAVYKNQGGSNFVRFVTSNLPGIASGAGRWGDYDKDGDLDILLAGYTEDHSYFAEIYRNDGSNGFVDIEADLEWVQYCEAAWGDFDGDGYLDVIIAGTASGGVYSTSVYLNRPGPFIDTDGDGLADEVETNTGTYNGPSDTGTDPDNPDSDGDGTKDGDEIRTGNDPTNPNERFAPTSLTTGPQGSPVIQWHSVTSLQYNINNGQLSGGSPWSNVYQASGSGGAMSYTTQPGVVQSGFYRLSADPL